jgi:hypothetical protein
MNETRLIKEYIDQLNENEKIAYSIGFLEFKKKQLSIEVAKVSCDDTLPS